MNIRVFKTMDGYNIIGEVVEQTDKYYLVKFPLNIMEDDISGRQYITKWLKYNESSLPIKIYIHGIAAEAPAAELPMNQYLDLVENYKQYTGETEESDIKVDEDGNAVAVLDMDDAEQRERMYKNVLEFIQKPKNGSSH